MSLNRFDSAADAVIVRNARLGLGFGACLSRVLTPAWLLLAAMAWLAGGPGWTGWAQTQPIIVANGSFESPVTPFVDLRIDGWQKTPKPAGFPIPDEQWEQSVGLFKNSTPDKLDHIDNMDGNQAIFIFNAPGAGVFQDYNSVDHAGRSQGLDVRYEVGSSYTLTAGVIGGGGGMPDGVTLLLSLYYRGEQNERVVIASTPVVQTSAGFAASAQFTGSTTHFEDFRVTLPVVKAGDAWAGRHIGIEIIAAGPPEIQGGYWDVDQVRLTVATPAVPVANGSFESPVTPFVDLRIDGWTKNPKPAGFPIPDEQWEQSVGLFKNPTPDKPDHIDNMEGNQAIFIFNAPGAGVFQDYDSVDHAGQTHLLTARYEVGLPYNLTVGLVGGGGAMPDGVTLLLSLYYRDAEGNRVTIAATPVVHSAAVFPSTTHFVDFQVNLPTVKVSDAWAGKYVGVGVMAIGPPEIQGGYWDVDDVRLMPGRPVVRLTSERAGSNLRLAWASAEGYEYQLQTSENLQTWSDVGELLPGTGQPLVKLVALPGLGNGFFKVRVTPMP